MKKDEAERPGVYVDAPVWRYRHMLMCHMFADNLEDLHAMADKLGIARRWFQDRPNFPHYDICKSKRVDAISHGAVEVSWREVGRRLEVNRKAGACLGDRVVRVFRESLASCEGGHETGQSSDSLRAIINDDPCAIQRILEDVVCLSGERDRHRQALEFCLKTLKSHHLTRPGISTLVREAEKLRDGTAVIDKGKYADIPAKKGEKR